MAQTWDSKRLQHERAMNDRLRDDMLNLASQIGQLVIRFATQRDENGRRLIPNRRSTREALRRQVWTTIIKPYFIGAGDDPLDGSEPQSPYMRLIRDGVAAAIRIQAQRQLSILKKVADPDIYQYLTGFRPTALDIREIKISEIGRPRYYDPWHLFVDPSGYTLSDKGWRTALEARRAIDALLSQHIPQGTAAVDIAELLIPYLWPDAAGITTRTPYGRVGSYWARRLARTEITAAAGRAVVNMSIVNPFVEVVDWALSRRHKCCDICDQFAADGPYPPDEVPPYPAHPHCWCSLIPRTTVDSKALNDYLRRQIRVGRLQHLQGAFNLDWLVLALLGGWFFKSTYREDDIAA